MTAHGRVFRVANTSILILLALVTLYPFWYVIVASLSPPDHVASGGFVFWPSRFYTLNYLLMIVVGGVGKAYLVSILRVLIGVPLMLVVTGSIAFALSRREMIGRKLIIYYLVPTLFLGGGLIPYYLLIRGLGLLNTFWVFVIPTVFRLGFMSIFKAFFTQTVPEGLVEAAVLEGAGYIRIFFSLVMPLSKAVFATIFLFNAVTHWNDWFTGAFFVVEAKLWPLQTWLQNVTHWPGGAWSRAREELAERMRIMAGGDTQILEQILRLIASSVQKAAVVLTMMPIIIPYPFLQRYFVKGALECRELLAGALVIHQVFRHRNT